MQVDFRKNVTILFDNASHSNNKGPGLDRYTVNARHTNTRYPPTTVGLSRISNATMSIMHTVMVIHIGAGQR